MASLGFIGPPTNNNIKLLENRITTNHEELMARVYNVETPAKEALHLAKKNEIIINKVLDDQQETWDDISQLLAGFITENLNLPYSVDTDSSRRKNKS